jgi:hypothetical protein
MDWSSPLSTVLGAVVGVGSALVVDRARSRRDRQQQWDQQRRQMYTDFMATLNVGVGELEDIARRGGLTQPERDQALWQALRAAGVWRIHQQLLISAPPSVISGGWDALMGLTEIRGVLAGGATFASQEYLAARKRYSELMASLRDAMRRDLNVPALPRSFSLRRPDIEPGPQQPAGSQAESP